MKKSKWIVITVVIGILAVVSFIAGVESKASNAKSEPVRVGVYDSRAVAVAYASSDVFDKILKERKKEYDEAKAAGNDEKVKEFEAWGEANQHKMHLQGFCGASVRELFEPVKDSLPKIAETCGVDIIVSQWQIDYQTPNLVFVDITDEIIKPFNPNERVLKIVESMKDQPLVSEEEIKKHDH